MKIGAKSERVKQLLPSPSSDNSFSPYYLSYFDHFNSQAYYQAHDVLEHLWLKGGNASPEYCFYKGLIQLAGAFVHMQKHFEFPNHPVHRRRLEPAYRLLERALFHLGKYPTLYHGLSLEKTRQLAQTYRDQLLAERFCKNPWSAQTAPMLTLQCSL